MDLLSFLAILFLLFWLIGIFFWYKSKDKNLFLGFLLIGPVAFLGKDLNRKFTKRESYGLLIILLIIVFVILFIGR